MPTIFTHAALPLAAGLGLGKRVISHRLLVAGIVASMLPDFDVIGFGLGVEYGSQFGHRGFTHSLFFAFVIALAGTCAYRTLQSTATWTFLFLFVSMASHGVLDSFTNGGQGIAFLWPFTSERFFSPFRVIEVSPIGLSRFLSPRGVAVLESEAVWVWLPCIVFCALIWAYRRRQANPVTDSP
jgi:inner membrane protein